MSQFKVGDLVEVIAPGSKYHLKTGKVLDGPDATGRYLIDLSAGGFCPVWLDDVLRLLEVKLWG